PITPQAEAIILPHCKLYEVVVDRAGDERLEPAAHQQVGLEPLAAGLDLEPQRMRGASLHNVVDVGAKDERLLARAAAHFHLYGEERRISDIHIYLLDRGDEIMPAVGILAQDAGKQLDERHPTDRRATIDPHTIAADLDADIAAVRRVPCLDRRETLALPLPEQRLQTGDAVGADVARHGRSVREALQRRHLVDVDL